MTEPFSQRMIPLAMGAVLLTALAGPVGPALAQDEPSVSAGSEATEFVEADGIRVSQSTASFELQNFVDPDILALLAQPVAADPDQHDHRHDYQALFQGGSLPVLTVPLDGASEMVIIQPRDAQGRGVEHTQLALRSNDGADWSPWTLLHSDGEEGPDGLPGQEGSSPAAIAGAGSIGPIWVGEGATVVEVALLVGEVEHVTTEALDVPEGPGETSFDSFNAQLLASAASWAGQPVIRSRTEWGSPGFQTGTAGCEDGPRYAESLRAMVVHHTVTTNDYSQDEVPKLLRGIHRFHTVSRGWCDVAYNFLVDRFGTLWEGRSGGITRPVIGGHARGFNSNTFAVALLGQHQSNISSPAPARPSAASLQAIKDLGAWKLRMHGVDPNGQTLLKNTASDGVLKHPPAQYVSVPTILGHRDLGVTSCPGNWTMPVVADMKAEFTPRALAAPIPYATTGITGNDFGPKIMAVDTRGGLRPALGQAAPASAPGGGAAAIAVGGTATAGYVLASDGTVRPYGDAPAVGSKPAGGSAPVDLVVRDSGKSGYVITADGRLHGFGGSVADRTSRGAAGVVAGDVNDDKVGYTVSASGRLFPVLNSPAAALKNQPAGKVIDLVVWSGGTSGYVLTDRGEVIGFGAATSFGDVVPTTPVSVVAGPNQNGGWVLDSEGRFWNFGDERPVTTASTHVGSGNAADAVLTGYDLSATRFGASSDFKYISGVLKRLSPQTVSAPFVDHWNWKTDFNGTISLGNAMVRRPEFTDSIVDDMYQRALNRSPDRDGRNYWTGLLNNDRISLRDMGVFFYGSDELFKRSGTSGRYVDALYASLLHRSPDAEGRAYWAGLLDSGRATPAEVTGGFYDSIESRRDRVDALYKRIGGSGLSGEQRERWANELLASDDLTLAAEMVASPTFYRYLIN